MNPSVLAFPGTIFSSGLLAALTGTGIWQVLAWIAMSVPVVAGIRYGIFTTRA